MNRVSTAINETLSADQAGNVQLFAMFVLCTLMFVIICNINVVVISNVYAMNI